MDDDVTEARHILLEQFRWVGGHANLWRIFRDGAALRAAVLGLVAPFRSSGITAVAGIESRGFLLGGAAAVELGVGFVAIRKAGALFPGEKARAVTAPDYRGRQIELLAQRTTTSPSDRILLVDDWIETGSQALAAAHLIADCGGELAAIAVLIDQLDEAIRPLLPPVHSLLLASDLPRE